MVYRSNCVKCPEAAPRSAALRWTLFNGQVSVVAPLCAEHMEPLMELVNLVGTAPLQNTGMLPVVPVRKMKVTPLEGWTKPDDD